MADNEMALELARTIRLFLPDLLGAGPGAADQAGALDQELAALIAEAGHGQDVAQRILDRLSQPADVHNWAAKFLQYGLPPDPVSGATRGFSLLAGQGEALAPAKFVCPEGGDTVLVSAGSRPDRAGLRYPPGRPHPRQARSRPVAAMLTRFLDSVSTKLADRLTAETTSALLFWAGGLLAYLLGHGGVKALDRPVSWVTAQSGVVQAALLAAALAGIAGSGAVVQRLTLPVLRVMEGYWPQWLGFLRRLLVQRRAAQLDKLADRWGKLAARVDAEEATAEERASYNRLDQRLRHMPSVCDRVMPTRVGNVLRAAESRPYDKYGLDAVKCWPQLWLVLPDEARQELSAARASLDSAGAACLWGLLFLIWGVWTLWAIPAGLAVTCAAYCFWVPDRAEVFADLVEAAFDLYRPGLYRALRWPLPTDPDDERKSGLLLTEYLWRGLDGTLPKFTTWQE